MHKKIALAKILGSMNIKLIVTISGLLAILATMTTSSTFPVAVAQDPVAHLFGSIGLVPEEGGGGAGGGAGGGCGSGGSGGGSSGGSGTGGGTGGGGGSGPVIGQTTCQENHCSGSSQCSNTSTQTGSICLVPEE